MEQPRQQASPMTFYFDKEAGEKLLEIEYYIDHRFWSVCNFKLKTTLRKTKWFGTFKQYSEYEKLSASPGCHIVNTFILQGEIMIREVKIKGESYKPQHYVVFPVIAVVNSHEDVKKLKYSWHDLKEVHCTDHSLELFNFIFEAPSLQKLHIKDKLLKNYKFDKLLLRSKFLNTIRDITLEGLNTNAMFLMRYFRVLKLCPNLEDLGMKFKSSTGNTFSKPRLHLLSELSFVRQSLYDQNDNSLRGIAAMTNPKEARACFYIYSKERNVHPSKWYHFLNFGKDLARGVLTHFTRLDYKMSKLDSGSQRLAKQAVGEEEFNYWKKCIIPSVEDKLS